MQEPPDGQMRNLNMTGDSRILVPRSSLTRFRTVSSLFGVLILRSRSCVSTMNDPLSDNLWLKCAKKAWLGFVMLGAQPLLGSSILTRGLVCQMHISELRARVTFHCTTSLSAGEMKLYGE
ncbi:hypothetical protein TNCV_3938991 [Trichonephila clavipes]|nr:hypothetical protein TNCV_3938991 [Trichonephila clavipes]